VQAFELVITMGFRGDKPIHQVGNMMMMMMRMMMMMMTSSQF
jgi:hypothetical protein